MLDLFPTTSSESAEASSVLFGNEYSAENKVTLFLGDCMNLLRSIPDSEAQLVITSPPYNIGKRYEKKRSLDAYLKEQRDVIAECVRVLRPGGSICWQVGNHLQHGSRAR
jgi:adenine-specific DNA-methyltransferase